MKIDRNSEIFKKKLRQIELEEIAFNQGIKVYPNLEGSRLHS